MFYVFILVIISFIFDLKKWGKNENMALLLHEHTVKNGKTFYKEFG